MAVRATKRGVARTRLDADCDVLICGASFAGLAAARELAGTRARVMIVDRYEVGERQTSACAAPTDWLRALDLGDSIRQTFTELVIHTPWTSQRYALPWSFSTFDYPALCRALLAQSADAVFETAKVEGMGGGGDLGSPLTVRTDRGELRAPLVLDALGWRRVLGTGSNVQPPRARMSRGLEVHPPGSSPDLEIWIDGSYVRAGYAWRFPAGEEVRVGVGSFEPRDGVKDSTVALARDLDVEPLGYQGNWIPHKLRAAVEDGVFFAGDSAGHCLPLTAEGIRTALYFGLACGRELRAVVEGRVTRTAALERYGSFSAQHRFEFDTLLQMQHVVGRIGRRRLMSPLLAAMNDERLLRWAFGKYLELAPPSFVGPAPARRAGAPAPLRFARAARGARPRTRPNPGPAPTPAAG